MNTMHVCKCYKQICWSHHKMPILIDLHVDFIIDKFSGIFEMGSCGH